MEPRELSLTEDSALQSSLRPENALSRTEVEPLSRQQLHPHVFGPSTTTTSSSPIAQPPNANQGTRVLDCGKDAAPLPDYCHLAAHIRYAKSLIWHASKHPVIAFLSVVTNLQKFAFVLFFRTPWYCSLGQIMTRDTCLPSSNCTPALMVLIANILQDRFHSCPPGWRWQRRLLLHVNNS